MHTVAMVTTWGQPCGISTYSEELGQALAEKGVKILALAPAEMGVAIREVSPKIPSRAVWTRTGTDLGDRLLRTIIDPNTQRPIVDVLHIQHEFGLFQQNDAFLAAVRECSRHLPVVVTLHTVFPYGTGRGEGFLDNLRSIVDMIIVHTPSAAAALACARGPRDNTSLIPHGTELRTEGDKETGLNVLGIPEKLRAGILSREISLGLVIGFATSGKNIEGTINAFAAGITRRLINKSLLVIVGDDAQTNYYGRLQRCISSTGYDTHFLLRPHFVAHEQLQHVLAAADYAVLNRQVDYVLSASGSVHVCAGAALPLAVANRPIHVDAIEAGAIPFEVEPNAATPTASAIMAISALSRDAGLRVEVGKRMFGYGQRTAWPIIAADHQALYACLLERRRARAGGAA
jgi:hypothetical protein